MPSWQIPTWNENFCFSIVTRQQLLRRLRSGRMPSSKLGIGISRSLKDPQRSSNCMLYFLGMISLHTWLLFSSLVSRVLQAVDPRFHEALIASNVRLAKGVVEEAYDREYHTGDITLKSYMEARRRSIGLQPFLDLGRWTWNLDLRTEVLSHPIIAKLEELTVDMVSLSNVMISSTISWKHLTFH